MPRSYNAEEVGCIISRAHRSVRENVVEAVAWQQGVVSVDEVQSHFQSWQGVGAYVLAAEGLDEREIERGPPGAIHHWRVDDVH